MKVRSIIMLILKRLKKKWCSFPITVKASIAYTLCGILQKGLSFITIPIFARLLTTEQYGQYTVYSSWLGIIIIFITLNLPYGSFATAMIKYENKRDEYIAAAEGVCIFLSGVFLILYVPFRDFWNKVFDMPTFMIIIMVLEILSSTAILLWSGKKRFEYKYKSVIYVTLVLSVLSYLSSYFFVYNFEEKGYAKIIGNSIITIIIGGTVYLFNIFKGKKIFSKEMWRFIFSFNLPLIIYYFSQVIFNQSDRIMISHYCGNDKAGMYGVAYSLSMVLIFVLNSINNAYLPWFYEKLKQNLQIENRPVTNMISVIMSGLLLIIIWFAPEIIYIMAGSAYSEAIWVVPPITISILLLFYSQLSINIEFYFEENKSLVKASIGAAVINIILNAIFIPRYGFIIAAYTTLISYIVFVVANYIAMKKILKKHNFSDNAYDYKSLLVILIIFSILSFIGLLLYKHMFIRILVAGVFMVILFLYRKKIFCKINYIKEVRVN